MVFEHFVSAQEAVQQICNSRNCRRFFNVFIDFADNFRLEASRTDIRDNSVEVLPLLKCLQTPYQSCESSNSIHLDTIN